jgi:CMP-N-acetylneuraminic acid synthetase
MKKLVAVIPVRKGSQRVQNKNIKPFANSSLLQIKIDTIKQLPVDDIIINTDCEIAIEIAKKNNVKYYRREDYYASSICNNSEYHEYLAKVTEAEDILIAQVTAPLISVDSYIDAIKTYYTIERCNSLMSTKSIKEFIWFEDKAINYDVKNAPNSQNLPDYFHPTFGIVICNRAALLESKNFICDNPYFYNISDVEAVDIDTVLDFEFAEFLYKKQQTCSDFKSLIDHDEMFNVGIDFDGVIHKCSKGYYDGTIYDEAIEGSYDALKKLSQHYKIIIYTCKAKPDRALVNGKTGTELVWEWLQKKQMDHFISNVTSEKPRAKFYIDDKAVRFKDWDEVFKKLNKMGYINN